VAAQEIPESGFGRGLSSPQFAGAQGLRGRHGGDFISFFPSLTLPASGEGTMQGSQRAIIFGSGIRLGPLSACGEG
jgi:hypothetical protein